MRRRFAAFVLASLALHASRAAACAPDDDSVFGLSDVYGELLPQRCKDDGGCRIFDLSGRRVGADGDRQTPGTRSEGLIGFRSGATALHGFMDAAGAVVIQAKYASVKPFCEGLAAVELPTRKWVHIDRTGNQVGAQWDDAESFSDGLANVSVLVSPAGPGKSIWMHGWVDHSGKLAIPTRYAGGTRPFSEGRAAVQLDGEKWGYIDRDARVAIPPRFATASRFRAGRAVATLDGAHFGLIDEKGKFVIAPKHARIGKFDNAEIWGVEDEDPAAPDAEETPMLERLFDREGRPLNMEVLVSAFPVLELSENLIAACRRDRKCGYLDASARSWAIPARFKGVESFSQGLAAASLDGVVWGFVDSKGEFVIAPRLDARGPETDAGRIGPFVGGLAPVGCNGHWGFVDMQGAWAVPPLYRLARGFERGFAAVELANGEAHILPDGTPIDFGANEIDSVPTQDKPCGLPLAAGAKWR